MNQEIPAELVHDNHLWVLPLSTNSLHAEPVYLLQHLTTFKYLGYPGITSCFLQRMSAIAPNLTVLDLCTGSYSLQISIDLDDLVDVISKFCSLTRLHFLPHSIITSNTTASSTFLMPLCKCTQIRDLDLNMRSVQNFVDDAPIMLGDTTICTLLEHMPHLQTIQLMFVNVSYAVLDTVYNNCPEFKIL